ncbi:Pectate lyase [Rhizoctonia solani]|uniref:Pectate lyase n=1 Tax=Rhizoctonia solani TaxID=456999 RepID=A0A8H7IEU8_9AGAM|nr:Pectate lyase [Rhizoctonia solani]
MVAISLAVLSAATGIFIQSVQAAPSPTTTHVDEFVRRDAEAPPFVKRAASCGNVRLTVAPVLAQTRLREATLTQSSSSSPEEPSSMFILSYSSYSYRLHLPARNVVIGANQAKDVCEDAITIKQTSGQSNIVGGGAKGASDKVQHNGGGTVKIDSYCVQSLESSIGLAATAPRNQYKRTVLISQIIGNTGSSLAGINSNYGDVAQFDTGSLQLTKVSSICDTYKGNSSGDEPTKLTSNTANS